MSSALALLASHALPGRATLAVHRVSIVLHTIVSNTHELETQAQRVGIQRKLSVEWIPRSE